MIFIFLFLILAISSAKKQKSKWSGKFSAIARASFLSLAWRAGIPSGNIWLDDFFTMLLYRHFCRRI